MRTLASQNFVIVWPHGLTQTTIWKPDVYSELSSLEAHQISTPCKRLVHGYVYYTAAFLSLSKLAFI